MQKKFGVNRLFLAVVCFGFIFSSLSCTKRNAASTEVGNICVNRLTPKASDYKISGAGLDSVITLFAANNLSTANLQFLYWSTDTTTNIYANMYSGYQEQVTATPYFNELPVFADNMFFTFDAGIFQPGGIYDSYTGPAPSSDTTEHQSMPGLRNAFLAHVSESYMEGGASNAKPFVPVASTYINSCLDVTLGYIDAFYIPGNDNAINKALVKVWKVTPTITPSITFYPVIYVEDDNGKAWGEPLIIP